MINKKALLTSILILSGIASPINSKERLSSRLYYMTSSFIKIDRSNKKIASDFPFGISGTSYNHKFGNEYYHVYPYYPLKEDSITQKYEIRDYGLSLKIPIPLKHFFPLELQTLFGDTLYLNKEDGRINKIGRTQENKYRIKYKKR